MYGHFAIIVAGLLTTTPKAPTPAVLFEPNRGQIDRSVAFMARGRSTSASIAADGSFTITGPAGDDSPWRLSIVPLGAATPRLDAIASQTAVRNVLLGRDESKWRRGLPLYVRVRATNLYPGIDAEYYGSGSDLEYDFVIAPGAKPSTIRLRIDGGSLRRGPDGSLVIATAAGELRQPRPVAYQVVDGDRRDVDVEYVVRGSQIGFVVGSYDASQTLIIDPLLVASTYAGSATHPSAVPVVVKFVSNGLLLAGKAGSDVYIAKYAIDGRTLLFETVFGGTGTEFLGDMAVDETEGAIYFGGGTTSDDLPTAGYQLQAGRVQGSDGFLAKLSTDGATVLLSTYMGTTGDDQVSRMALGADLYVVSSFVPLGVSGCGPCVLRLARDGRPRGILTIPASAAALATGPDGTVYIGMTVTGSGLATPGAFQTTPGSSACWAALRGQTTSCRDVLIAHYSADLATRLWATYLREATPQSVNADDFVDRIVVDATGNVIVAGNTLSATFPITPGAFDPVCKSCNPPIGCCAPSFPGTPFLTKLNASGSALIFSTFVNGNNAPGPGLTQSNAAVGGVAVDPFGNVSLAGHTWNASFATVGPPLPQAASPDSTNTDAFLTVFTPSGNAIYSSRFGGPGADKSSGVAMSPFSTTALIGPAGASFPLQNAVQSSGTGFLSIVALPRIHTVLDVPAPGSLTRASSVTIRGWALDPAATSGTGIDSVNLTATPLGGGAPIGLGPATLGGTRSDVALAFGTPAFAASGFSLTTTLAPGPYAISAVAHSTVSDTTGAPATAQVTALAGTFSKIQSPSAGTLPTTVLTLSGFAVDLDASTGTGVDAVHVWAYPSSGGPVFLGVANYGETRSELADMFGAQFTSAGFSLTASTLAPGTYLIAAHAHSTVTGTFSAAGTVTVTVPQSATELYFSTPTGPDVYPGFTVGGWAIDPGAPADTGIDAIHVWAFPAGGGPAIFLGATTTFVARSDVAAARGSRFLMSGFNVKTANLPPGNYTVVAYAHSTVAQAFNAAQVRALRVIAATGAVIQVTNIPDPARVNGVLTLTGYAFDPRAASGLGIDGIHMYVYPNWGSGAPAQFIGLALHGFSSGPEFGSQFTSAGFSAWCYLPEGPGTHLVVLFAHSAVDGSFTAVTRLVTVPVPQFLVTVDQPQPGQTVVGPFHIRGWAIDRSTVDVTPDGSGIEYIQIYAYPVAGGGPIGVCGESLSGFRDRPDIAAAFGPRFLKSGFDCLINNGSLFTGYTLAPGTYDLAVFAKSLRTRQYSPPTLVRFTVQ